MKKSVLAGLLVVILSIMFATVSSFAADKSEKKPIKGTTNNAVTKQMTERQLSDEEKSQIEGFVKKEKKKSSDIEKDSYSDPVVYEEDGGRYIELYYPGPWVEYCVDETMYVDYSIWDTWESYYTIPITGIFDEYDNLITYVEGDVAGVGGWTNYTGYRNLSSKYYSPGFYTFVIFNVPCNAYGVPVRNWSEWDNIPMVSVRFEVCNHYYSSWKTTKKATEISAGQKTRYCYYCGKEFKKTIKQLKPSLPAISIKKPVAAKKAATVKWTKVKKANQKKIAKIQIQYSTNKKFSKGVKTVYASKSATSKKIKGLKSKKTYYVRIRAYKKDSKGVHVSKWSSVKAVKAK